jgi:DNA-binding PadR family transcriptional regulator
VSHPQDAPQLGWIQIQILFLLWNYEMYGLEITRMLGLRSVKIGVNQLYPALRRLEDKGALESRRVERVGTTRVYYRTTEHGRQLAIHQYLDFGELIQEAAIGRLVFIPEGLRKIVEFKRGDTVLDFSGRFYDLFVKHIAQSLGVEGRYIVYSTSSEEAEVYRHRAEYYSLNNVTVAQEKEPNVLDLPDGTVDVGLSYLNIRTPDRLWRMRELRRLLKPTGVAIFVDWHQPRENVRMEIMSSIFPGNIGVEPDQFGGWLRESGLRQTGIVEERGLLYITAMPA